MKKFLKRKLVLKYLSGLLMKFLVFIARHLEEHNERKYFSIVKTEKIADVVKFIVHIIVAVIY